MTYLNLPTGFTQDQVNKTLFHTHAHAGLEIDPYFNSTTQRIECQGNVSIFKTPRFISKYDWISAKNLNTVIIPMRDSTGAAKSRQYQSKYIDRVGGWVEALSENASFAEQLNFNNNFLSLLLLKLSRMTRLHVILLSYPEHVRDGKYAFHKLKSFMHSKILCKHGLIHDYSSLA